MEITFLIGNGFDLGVGLKTKYGDFYKKYCVEHITDNDNIRNFKKTLLLGKLEFAKTINWSDFEKAFGKYSENFPVNKKQLYIECFEDFVANFNTYLEKEESKIDYSNEELIVNTMMNGINTFYHIRQEDKNKISSVYQRIQSGRRYNFISFNYTSVLDNCVKHLKNKFDENRGQAVGEVMHVHGYVDQNMIIGVNDASQIANTNINNDDNIVHELTKPLQNSDSRTGYDSAATNIINNSDIICIYGMSIGDTDKKWWNLIAKWLASNSIRRLVILTYTKEYNARFPYTQRKVTERITDCFLSHSDLADEIKNDIRNRIYIGANHNVFSMNLINNENTNVQEENKAENDKKSVDSEMLLMH